MNPKRQDDAQQFAWCGEHLRIERRQDHRDCAGWWIPLRVLALVWACGACEAFYDLFDMAVLCCEEGTSPSKQRRVRV